MILTSEQHIRIWLIAKLGNMSQIELSKRIGITPQYLHDILHGRRNADCPKVLKWMGIKKVVTYAPARTREGKG